MDPCVILTVLAILQFTTAQVVPIRIIDRNANEDIPLVSTIRCPRHLSRNGQNPNIWLSKKANLVNQPVDVIGPKLASIPVGNVVNGNINLIASGNEISYNDVSVLPVKNNINTASVVGPNILNNMLNKWENIPSSGGLNQGNVYKSGRVTYTFGNEELPVKYTNQPRRREVGIQLFGENLEVGGNVLVMGKMPIYGAVALNGKLATDGTATVVNCDRV